MMKRLAVAAVVFACLNASVGIAETTVGYVDIERVTAKANSVTQPVRDATEQVRELQRRMTDKLRLAEELDAQLKKDTGTLSEEVIAAKRKDRAKLDGDVYDLEREIRLKERSIETDVFVPLQRSLLNAIEDVAKARKLDLVVNSKSVLYGSTNADMTQEVIDRLDKSTAGASATPKPTKSPTTNKDTTSVDAETPAPKKD